MKILKIRSFDNESIKSGDDFFSYEGYEIETTDSIIKIGVSNGESCCESYGYICSADKLEEYIGAKILKVEKVKLGDWKKCEILLKQLEYSEEEETAFINFETDKGLLQFAVYNTHNGYYGHDVVIEHVKK